MNLGKQFWFCTETSLSEQAELLYLFSSSPTTIFLLLLLHQRCRLSFVLFWGTYLGTALSTSPASHQPHLLQNRALWAALPRSVSLPLFPGLLSGPHGGSLLVMSTYQRSMNVRSCGFCPHSFSGEVPSSGHSENLWGLCVSYDWSPAGLQRRERSGDSWCSKCAGQSHVVNNASKSHKPFVCSHRW